MGGRCALARALGVAWVMSSGCYAGQPGGEEGMGSGSSGGVASEVPPPDAPPMDASGSSGGSAPPGEDESGDGSDESGGEMPPPLPSCEGMLTIVPCTAGFGMETPAGSGRHVDPPQTTIIPVTTLADDGPGSLREAMLFEGPRTIVFEVSGVIELQSEIHVQSPYMTVAGQTAPSPGITITGGYELVLGSDADDVLIQHLRFRVGDAAEGTMPGDRDNIMQFGDRIVLDHCSFSWSIDENLDSFGDDVAVNQCIFSEALHSSSHPKGAHSRGAFIETAERVSFVGNLFAHNMARNPVLKKTRGVVINNLIYNYGGTGIKLRAHVGEEATTNSVIGNHLIPGGNSDSPKHAVVVIVNQTESRIYFEDNRVGDTVLATAADTWPSIIHWKDLSDKTDVDPAVQAESAPVTVPDLEIRPSAEVHDWVLDRAGARPSDRDAIDERIVQSVRDGTGAVIDSPNEVGGLPPLAENVEPFVVPADPMGDEDADGYTNLEEALHLAAAAVE